jgi:DNA-binding NarL/FixJ family response regulator
MIRVLIADDQALVRGGFRAILSVEDDIEVVGEAGDGREAVSTARILAPDVVLLDVRMPGMDGLEAAHELAQSPSKPRVLMLTTFDNDAYLHTAMRAGASGFLLKTVSPGELVQAVRTVARGNALLDSAMTRRLLDEFTRRPPPGALPALLDQLTAREVEVLSLVGRGLSNADIGRALFISEATAKTHVASILRKTTVGDRVGAVVLAYETGLVRPGENPDPGKNS